MSVLKDTPASILSRLLQYSKKQNENYQSLLTRYAAERFLYRLGKSPYRDVFVLKGAYLLTLVLENQTYRTTKDIDFLKTGNTETEELLNAIKHICLYPCLEDGIIFNTETIRFVNIRKQNTYHGQRVKVLSFIGKTRIPLQIDIGFGDTIHPDKVYRKIPSVLHLNGTSVTTYPLESVISEKLEAIVSLSMLTSRMKDFYDIYIIITNIKLNYTDLVKAVTLTFKRRKTEIPKTSPEVFSEEIWLDPLKNSQWRAFTTKLRNEYSTLGFQTVLKLIDEFSKIFWNDDGESYTSWIPGKGWV